MKNRDRKCCMIQCKISAETAERIERIVKEGGFASPYEFLQYLLSAFLRFADPEKEGIDEMSEELLAFAKIYEGWENKKNRVITTRPSGNKALKLVDSINIYSEIGRRGYVCKMLSLRGEDVRTSGSIVKALDVLIKKLFPSIAVHLANIGRNIGEETSFKAIEYMIEDAERKGLTEAEKAMPASPTSNEYGNVPKKKKSKSLNDE